MTAIENSSDLCSRSRSQVNTHFSFRRQVAVMDPEHAGGVVPVFVWVDGWSGLLAPKKQIWILWTVEGFLYFCSEIQVVHSEDFGFVWYLHFGVFSTIRLPFCRCWLRWRRHDSSCILMGVGDETIDDYRGFPISLTTSEPQGQVDTSNRVWCDTNQSFLGDWRFHCANLMTGQVEMDYTCKYVYNN